MKERIVRPRGIGEPSLGPLSSPFGFRIQELSTVDGICAKSDDNLIEAFMTSAGFLAAPPSAALSASPMPAVSGPITSHSGATISAAF
jgi:hypothetical protein